MGPALPGALTRQHRHLIAGVLWASAYWLLLALFIYACFLKPEPRSLLLSLQWLTLTSPWGLISGLIICAGSAISNQPVRYWHLASSSVLMGTFLWGQV